MKKTFPFVLFLALCVACGSAPSTNSSNVASNQNSAAANSTGGAVGEAGKAPSPSSSPSPSTDGEGATKVVNVRFPTGATQASYTDSFTGYGYIDYVFSAKANQKLTAEITKADGNRAVMTVMKDGQPVEVDASQVQGWTGLLPDNGSYTIRVGQMRNDARKDDKPVKFSLLISIVNE